MGIIKTVNRPIDNRRRALRTALSLAPSLVCAEGAVWGRRTTRHFGAIWGTAAFQGSQTYISGAALLTPRSLSLPGTGHFVPEPFTGAGTVVRLSR